MVVNLNVDETFGLPPPEGYDELVFGEEYTTGANLVLVGAGDSSDPPETEAAVIQRCKEEGRMEPRYVSAMSYEAQRNFATTLEKGDLITCTVFRTKQRTLHTFHGFVKDFTILANGSRVCNVSYPNTPRHVPQFFHYRLGSGSTVLHMAVRRVASAKPQLHSFETNSVTPAPTPLDRGSVQQQSATAAMSAASWTNSAASWADSAASWPSSATGASPQVASPASPPPTPVAPQAAVVGSPAGAVSPTAPIVRGDFVIFRHEVLGTGGFGTVYKAFSQVTGETVAAKVLHAMDSVASLKALADEAAMLAALKHPQIVRIVGFDATPPQPVLFLEWMPGGSLSSLLQRLGGIPLGTPVVARYLRQILQGLAFLHDRGIVWRDGKPQNVLLAADGSVRLSDFGLCKEISSSSGGASSSQPFGNSAAGTVPYFSPECVRGHQGKPADVYAIGCIALELATGNAPWSTVPHLKGNAMALLFTIGTAQPPNHHPPIADSVQGPLRDFIMRCFAFDPKERPTAAELLEDALFSGI